MFDYSDYQREESKRVSPGKYRVAIVDVVECESKTSGKPMIVLTLQISGTQVKVKHFIVKNSHFNKNMTEFFDSFPTIGDGNFNFMEWVGAVGAGFFKEGEKGYLELRYFINPSQAKDLPEWEGEKPEQQKVASIFPGDNDAPPAPGDPITDDDLPF